MSAFRPDDPHWQRRLVLWGGDRLVLALSLKAWLTGRPLMFFRRRLIAFIMLSASVLPASEALSFEADAICRAAIASITDRDPKGMQVSRTVGDVLFLTYLRPIDNFVWTYRCRIEGDRVMWATEPGRWREGPKDDKIFFEIVDAEKQLRIIEVHRDGSRTQQLFNREAIP
jgi:hypothetical protein